MSSCPDSVPSYRKPLSFDLPGRIILAAVSAAGLGLFPTLHRLFTFFEEGLFTPWASPQATIKILYWLIVCVISAICSAFIIIHTRLWEAFITRVHTRGEEVLDTLGARAVVAGILNAAIVYTLAGTHILLDPTLLNIWDVIYIVVFGAIVYIGSFLQIYHGAKLGLWRSESREAEMERLKLEFEEQRMWFRGFLWIIAVFLLGWVFAPLRIKYEQYLQEPSIPPFVQYQMIINGFQIVYLIFSIWALILARILRRMEEVKLALRILPRSHD